MKNMEKSSPEAEGKKKKGRRGIAIELAISTVMILSVLSTMLVTVSLLTRDTAENYEELFDTGLQLDMIGEDFCYSVKRYVTGADETFSFDIGAYPENYIFTLHAPAPSEDSETLYRMSLSDTTGFLLGVTLCYDPGVPDDPSDDTFDVVEWTFAER